MEHSTTLTMDFVNAGYNDVAALIFTRGALSAFTVQCDNKGQVYSHNISNILGNSNLTVTHSGSKVTLTVGAWQTFEMLFVLHGNVLPTLTIS